MVKIVDCPLIRKQIAAAIRKDFELVKRNSAAHGEPTLAVLVFKEMMQAKKFVMRKTDSLVKLGFKVEVSFLPKHKDEGSRK